MENFESGSFSEPTIETLIVSMEEKTIDPTGHYKELVGAKGWETLEELRGEASAILAKYAIAALLDEELRKTVPGLTRWGGSTGRRNGRTHYRERRAIF